MGLAYLDYRIREARKQVRKLREERHKYIAVRTAEARAAARRIREIDKILKSTKVASKSSVLRAEADSLEARIKVLDATIAKQAAMRWQEKFRIQDRIRKINWLLWKSTKHTTKVRNVLSLSPATTNEIRLSTGLPMPVVKSTLMFLRNEGEVEVERYHSGGQVRRVMYRLKG